MIIRSGMSLIMSLIGLEQLQLFALELENNAIFDLNYTLASTIINRSAANLVKIYMIIRPQLSSIMGVIGPEQLSYFPLKIAFYHIVYTVASTNINTLVPNLVKLYVTIRSRISSIMGVIRPEQLEVFAIELESSLE